MEKLLIDLKKIHEKLLEFLESETFEEIEFENIVHLFAQYKILEEKIKFKGILNLIAKISNNHFYSPDLFYKIERILQTLKNEINNYFTNIEIFKIFQNSKRLLLFLFKEKIIIPDFSIFTIISETRLSNTLYFEYFYLEFESFFTEKMTFPAKEMNIEEFETKRKIGQNDSYICQLIQNDLVVDFITYINKNNIPLSSIIQKSIFETNSFLIDKDPTLIEYAAFYGSIQIFQYLKRNQDSLDRSLFLYAIHSNNAELFVLLQESDISIEDSFESCLIESIKCHHIDITNYIQTNLYEGKSPKIILNCIKYFNFISFPEKFKVNSDVFYFFCKYEYNQFIKLILSKKINIYLDSYYTNYIKIKQDNYFEYDLVRVEESTPLCVSIQNENIEVVRLLLEQKDVNVNLELKYAEKYFEGDEIKGWCGHTYKKTPLFIAVEKKNIEIIKLLIEQKNFWINKKSIIKDMFLFDEYTALKLAIEKENIKIVQLLLNVKDIDLNENLASSIDMFQRYEESYLHIAVKKGNIKILQLLLSNNQVNPNVLYKYTFRRHIYDVGDIIKELEIKTPLQIAVEQNNLEIAQLLLSIKKVKINCVCQDYEKNYYHNIIKKHTPLIFAVKNNQIEMVRLLMSRSDINVNAIYSQYEEGSRKTDDNCVEKTALIWAIENQNVEMIKLLLSHKNIDLSICYRKNKKEVKTVLDVAEMTKNQEIIDILTNYKRNESYYEYLSKKILRFFSQK